MEEKIIMQQQYELELSRARVEVHEQTLQTIGADLHDHIGQLLSLTNLTLKSIDEINLEKTREKVDTAIELTSKSIQQLRLLGKMLQGEQLVRDGLNKSISYELDWLERMGRYKIIFREHESALNCSLDANKELMVLRIFQEIINNILKHAEASELAVDLSCTDSLLELRVSDNGKGFDAMQDFSARSHMGLANIAHRAKLIEGSTEIISKQGSGTTIILRLPFDFNNENSKV